MMLSMLKYLVKLLAVDDDLELWIIGTGEILILESQEVVGGQIPFYSSESQRVNDT